MNNKYIEVRPQVNFETKHLQDIIRIQQQSAPELIQEQEQNVKNIDNTQVEEFDKMYQLTQRMSVEKKELLDTIEQLKLKIADLEKLNSKTQALGALYQKESSNSQNQLLSMERRIEALEIQLENQQQQLEEEKNGRYTLQSQLDQNHNWISQINQTLRQFLKDHKIDIDTSDLSTILQNQIIIEYLINTNIVKQNQELRYEQHIRDNIQIIYDLQNKIQDMIQAPTIFTTSPKNQDTLKLSKMSSGSLHPTQDQEEKIKNLKKQGKMINKNWQIFCESILKERNEYLRQYRYLIEQLNEQISQLHQTLNELLQQLSPKQQQLWIEYLETKEEIHRNILTLSNQDNEDNKEALEEELKLLYQKLAFIKQKIDTDLTTSQNLSKSEMKRMSRYLYIIKTTNLDLASKNV
ncbi:hypothetical protein pb186bvf_010891 [Paramecium bursaria]